MAHPYSAHKEMHPGQKKAKERVAYKRGGAAKHDDEKQDRALFKSMMSGHDTKIEGKKSGGRLDKYARGGKTKGKKAGNHVNIAIVAPHGPHPSESAAPAIPPAPPLLPGGGGPPGMPPPGAGGPPPGMMRRGGRAKFAKGGKIGMTAGSESGEGRLQKARKYSAK